MTGALLIIIAFLISMLYLSKTENKHLFNENNLLRELKPRDLWLIKERIKLMSPRDFEIFTAQLFSFLGYKSETTKETRDGGKDVILFKDNEYTFVECKHWTEYETIDGEYVNGSLVGQEIAQKLRGAMDYGFDGKTPIPKGIIISTTNPTEQCKIYCQSMNIEFINMDGVMQLVESIGTEKLYWACGIKRDGYVFE